MNKFDFKNKTAVITGGAQGFGLEIAKNFLLSGAKVYIWDIDKSELEKASKLLNNENLKYNIVDVTKFDEIKKTVDEIIKSNKIDILINNAGYLVNKPFNETTLEDFQTVYSTNVFSVAMLIKNTIDFMESGSNVLNISSIGGIQGSVKFPGLSAYSSSKGALNILTEMLAEEYKDRGIHFNSLALGSVQTKMLEKAFPNFTASTSALEMAEYIYNFSTNGYRLMNGKVISVSSTTP